MSRLALTAALLALPAPAAFAAGKAPMVGGAAMYPSRNIVVPGRVSAAQLVGKIKAGRGMARLATVQGGTLTARLMGGKVVLTDEKGGRATVTQADVLQSTE